MKLITIGDSITYGQFTSVGETSPLSLAKPYGEIIAQRIKADSYINYGMNGCSFSKTSLINSDHAFEQQVSQYDTADLIILAGGTNDFGTNVKLNDFQMSVSKVLAVLITKNPQAQILVVTPLPRYDEVRNDIGLTLNDYRRVLSIEAKARGLLVINGESFPIDPHDEKDRNQYMVDGVHLNNAAHQILADFIIRKGHLLDRKDVYIFNGYEATVIIPPNFTGRWIWKTEFFYAFDQLEQSLLEAGFARVFYQISDKYGSPNSIKLMYDFYLDLQKRYSLNKKCDLVGFSRGGLYAFNFTLAYPHLVKHLYLDAPVLDLRTWPRKDNVDEYPLYLQVFQEYGFINEEEYAQYPNYPIDKIDEYLQLKIPTLLVAGANDTVVDFSQNSEILIDAALSQNASQFYYFVKNGLSCEGGDHHPHSFGNRHSQLIYGCLAPDEFQVYSNRLKNSSPTNLIKVKNSEEVLMFFFK